MWRLKTLCEVSCLQDHTVLAEPRLWRFKSVYLDSFLLSLPEVLLSLHLLKSLPSFIHLFLPLHFPMQSIFSILISVDKYEVKILVAFHYLNYTPPQFYYLRHRDLTPVY